ncbi:MAG: Nif3-like dinuclear metal center hexameric protein [Oryzomonas sp.]|uniref:Nif3-like dinuclear metal center hexameric protein n=1 Tax=Oryzomonas sp. TaxID=2855186 RepID=UPI002847C487|nr:Nif3-like dinuclear metal center hexameric protein [Oryzomonas sp.]MDR3579167.1 Nif3-like dinuclear metal center hexameric protein [Oryzomonas sp.]
MKTPKLSDILGIINKIAPPGLAESWDNSGLQVGDPDAGIERIMVSLDATPAVMEAALNASCQLLVTHHPLLFKPLKTLSTATPQGKLVHAAIRGNLAVISIHTSYDVAEGGLNDLLAERLGVYGCRPLQAASGQDLCKLVVFVPCDHLDRVRTVLFPLTEALGNYRDCSFSAPGEGTFTPQTGATPFIGAVGSMEKAPEQRLELLIERSNLTRAVRALLAAHPYEEPAFDIYPLLNEGKPLGLGRVGSLAEQTNLADYAGWIKKALNAPGLRYAGNPATVIKKVALCSGSGASLLRAASRCGADVLVTGDVKYHDARDALDLGIALIDAGHFPSEIIMVDDVAERLGRQLSEAGYGNCCTVPCRIELDPFRV